MFWPGPRLSMPNRRASTACRWPTTPSIGSTSSVVSKSSEFGSQTQRNSSHASGSKPIPEILPAGALLRAVFVEPFSGQTQTTRRRRPAALGKPQECGAALREERPCAKRRRGRGEV